MSHEQCPHTIKSIPYVLRCTLMTFALISPYTMVRGRMQYTAFSHESRRSWMATSTTSSGVQNSEWWPCRPAYNIFSALRSNPTYFVPLFRLDLWYIAIWQLIGDQRSASKSQVSFKLIISIFIHSKELVSFSVVHFFDDRPWQFSSTAMATSAIKIRWF